MVKNILSTLNTKQRLERESMADQAAMYANNNAISIDCDLVHVYNMSREKLPPSMLKLDSSFCLSVNYFKTEAHASVEGKNWFKAQPMGVNKLNNIMKDEKSGGNFRQNKP